MKADIEDPVLGRLSYDAQWDEHRTEELPIACLGGHRCRFVLDGYTSGDEGAAMRDAITRLLAAGPSLLADAEPHVVAYCEDMLHLLKEYGEDVPIIAREKPGDIWSHVRFGDTFDVSVRKSGDDEDGVYLSLECNCDWEIEHGLQLVVRDGRAITKVGGFDGHATNSDAFADRAYAGVVYVGIDRA